MKDFFKTLMRPDREEDPERSEVARAANILQVGEFQVLQLAYHEWYGEELPEHLSDRLFRSYMLYGDVPAWARDYAQRIIRQDEIGLIDERDPGYHRYDREYVTHVPQGVRHFVVACMILAVIGTGLVVLAETANVNATSLFPPYIDTSEVDNVAR